MIPNWIMTYCRRDEITRDHLCSLMNELVKSMLSVRSWFTPDNRPGLIIYCVAVTINRFSIALHIALLEIGGKAIKVLIIGENRLRCRSIKIVIPNSEQRKNHRDVLFKGLALEVLIHGVSTFEHADEIVKA